MQKSGAFEEESFEQWKKLQIQKNDEFGKIEVPHKVPLVLQVTIVDGRDIKRTSILNLVDKPNPQIVVEYGSALGTKKFATAAIIDNVNPVWNETFTYVLSEEQERYESQKDTDLKFFLIVEDWHDSHDIIATASYDISQLPISDSAVKQTIDFGEKGEITVLIKKEYSQEEMEFRFKRIPKVMNNMKTVLGENYAPKDLFETPVMSVVGSGGGFRAMIGMCGVMEALQETGLLDCMTYAVGTSGSGWYLSSAYAWQALTHERQKEYHKRLKKALQSPLARDFLSIDRTMRFKGVASSKKRCGQPVTLVDFYGYNLGKELVGTERATMKLSEMREYVSKADVPYLILTAQQVHESIDTWSYHADCNFTPFEFELPHYGINANMELFNSEFHSGVLSQKLNEPPLRYIQALIGSAFSLRLASIFNIPDDKEEKDFFEHVHQEVDIIKEKGGGLVEAVRSKVIEWFDALPHFMNRGFFVRRCGDVLNFARGHTEQKRFGMNPFADISSDSQNNFEGLQQDVEVISLIDAGLLTNIGTDPVLRPQRMNDILFIFDYINTKSDIATHHILRKAVTLAKKNGLKFPPVDFEKISRESLKELYVFEDAHDPDCPLVFYFYACTTTFKKIKNYRAKDRSFLERIFNAGSEFTDFDVIGTDLYSTLRTEYEERDFERLKELMWFNVITNTEILKRKIHQKILQKRSKKNEASQ